jgi:general secretion pathway protein F
MPTFRYQAYTPTGKAVKGRKEGPSRKAVRDQLLSEGVLVRDIQPVTSGKAKRATPAVRSILYRELSALLHAGLPLDRALEILAEHPELASDGDVLPAVRDRVREGGEFSESLKRQLPGLREEEAAVLAAGEAAGTLASVCNELADALEIESELQDQARTALVYPGIITGLSLLILGVMVGVLLPTYEEMLGDVDMELPLLTRVLLGTGRWMRSLPGLAVLLALAGGIVVGVRKLTFSTSDRLAEFLFRVPVVGAVRSSRVRARFARTLALLLEGGVPVPLAVEGAGRATGSGWLTGKCAEAAGQLSQGSRVAEAIAAVPVLQEDLPGWIRAGEASGDLPGLLRHAASGHERAWRRGMDRLLALLEPALIIAVGGLILLVALAILLPMLRMNQFLTGS